MSHIYRIVHPQQREHYVLKVLDPQLLLGQRRKQRWQLCARMRREGRIQGELVHENLLRAHELIDVDGLAALVLDYVDGPALDELLHARYPLEPKQIEEIAVGVITGVCVAHEAGVVHRDLKPSNVLIARVGDRLVPKIADFGLAKEAQRTGAQKGPITHQPITFDTELTRTGQVFGTPGYMAPEQTRDSKHVDARSDVFALGVVLYELITGERLTGPSEEADVAAVARGLAGLDALPDVPERHKAAIRGALVDDEADRIGDAPTLLAVWEGRIVPEQRSTTPPQRSWVAPLAGLGTLILFGALALAALAM
ncbi:MAG TPA: serine/threonine protein kinase [Deltaproteobacteria bacterium]|nr:serine/threonine protein kinase [Deltaproteobacteria bacterium]